LTYFFCFDKIVITKTIISQTKRVINMKKITAILLAFVICFSVISPSAFAASGTRDTTSEQVLASDLKSLSLFKGESDTDYALSRAPTRTEAVVMLIRLLGKESEAQSGSWTQPFGDVASWADKYVGYAYQNGLTNGVSSTEFGNGNANAATFLTLLLRALGYSEADGDFTYSDPFTLAKSLGLLPDSVDTSNFLRADAVLVSYSALPVKIKGTSQTLADKLISAGVFTHAQYSTYYDTNAISNAESSAELTAEQIYAKCSPAVFYIEVYNSDGTATASGSGFFIDSNGTAVTNYHVIKGAYSAKITVSNTNKVYNVLGVYDYSVDNDWAILKIDGSGFSYMDLGSSASVVGGATVYAIGSPLGLQNTISDGLISNPARTENGVTYIQTSAAISSGSSGGALINKFGKVIGITCASYVEGQSLNLALPISYISGYKTSEVTALSNLVKTAVASDPYSALKSYLESKGSYNSSVGGYMLSVSGSYSDYYILYRPGNQYDLCLISKGYSGSATLSSLICLSDSTTAYYEAELSYPALSESGNITKASFTSSTALSPQSYSGSSTYESKFNSLCTSTFISLLAATEEILEDNDIPVTIKDLGFDAAYAEVTSS